MSTDSFLIDDDGKAIDFADAREPLPADEPTTAVAVIEPTVAKRRVGRPRKNAQTAPAAVEAPEAASPAAPPINTRSSLAGKATRTSPPPMAGTSAGPGRYRVSLDCPTPVEHKTLEVDAQHEDDARQKYCDANGISGSSWPWQIERVG